MKGWEAVAPAVAGEAAAAVKAARAAGLPVWIRGAGTKEGVPGPAGPGVALSTSRLSGEPEISPANLTASFPAGTPLAKVNEILAPHGLFFPMEDPFPAATAGGAVACGSSGPLRLGYGNLRDWVLGLEVVTAAGEIIRTGRPTMKNVAGYNLTRLMCGSWGTLGVITKAILRLSPLPTARVTLAASFGSAAAAAEALLPLLRRAPLPAAADWLSKGTGASGRAGTLLVRFTGEAAGVVEQAASARRALAPAADKMQVLDSTDDEAAWAVRRLAIHRLYAETPVRLRMGVAPGKAGAAARVLLTTDGWLAGHMGNGILVAGLTRIPSEQTLQELRARAAEAGGYLTAEAGSPELAASLSQTGAAWADDAVREALAPGRCFNPHRQL